METFLLQATGHLPGAGWFLVGTAVLLLAAGGVSVLLEQTCFGRWLGRVATRILTGLVAALLLIMVALSATQILLRNLFDEGLLWIDPLLRHLVLVLAFTGSILATAGKRHVQINALGRLLRGGVSRVAGAAVAALAGTVCVVLGHAALQLLAAELEFVETLFLGVPAWGVALVFPTSFLTMAFQFFRLVFLELAGQAPISHELPAGEGAEDLYGSSPMNDSEVAS